MNSFFILPKKKVFVVFFKAQFYLWYFVNVSQIMKKILLIYDFIEKEKLNDDTLRYFLSLYNQNFFLDISRLRFVI